MRASHDKDQAERSEAEKWAETQRVMRRMIETPPQPHVPGTSGPRKIATPARKKTKKDAAQRGRH